MLFKNDSKKAKVVFKDKREKPIYSMRQFESFDCDHMTNQYLCEITIEYNAYFVTFYVRCIEKLYGDRCLTCTIDQSKSILEMDYVLLEKEDGDLIQILSEESDG